MKLNCVIVDDEPLASEGLAGYVKEVDFLSLTGTCENPVQLMSLMESQPVDLIFLDIQMPKMTGIDFLRIVRNPPMVILTTAFPDFAIEGFQLNVLDYLLKPIRFNRFYQAAMKAADRYVPKATASGMPPPAEQSFFVKCGNKFEKIFTNRILYVEGLQNYVTIYTTNDKFITILSLKSLEESLDPDLFIRVHKSYIVSISKVQTIEGNELIIREKRIPMSRRYKEKVMEKLFAKPL